MTDQEKITRICDAIKNKSLIKFWYETKTTKDFRTIEPHLLGELKDTHEIAVRGWFLPTQQQTTKRMNQGWRTYLIKDISRLTVLNEKYKLTRKLYNPNDADMVRIICRTAKTVQQA